MVLDGKSNVKKSSPAIIASKGTWCPVECSTAHSDAITGDQHNGAGSQTLHTPLRDRHLIHQTISPLVDPNR